MQLSEIYKQPYSLICNFGGHLSQREARRFGDDALPTWDVQSVKETKKQEAMFLLPVMYQKSFLFTPLKASLRAFISSGSSTLRVSLSPVTGWLKLTSPQ